MLGNLGIVGLDGSGDASFDVWVDAQNVVQRITFSSTGRWSMHLNGHTEFNSRDLCLGHD